MTQYFGNFEEKASVIVATSSKKSAVGRPCESAYLLCMGVDSSKAGHGSVPSMPVSGLWVGPLNRVVVHVADVVAHQ